MIPEGHILSRIAFNSKLMYDDSQMRRVCSILFVLLFGLGPLAVAVDGDDASLPACCRRHGAHHCAMSSAVNRADSQTPALAAPSHCPFFPQGNASPSPTAILVRPAFSSILNGRQTFTPRHRVSPRVASSSARSPSAGLPPSSRLAPSNIFPGMPCQHIECAQLLFPSRGRPHAFFAKHGSFSPHRCAHPRACNRLRHHPWRYP